MSGQITLPKDKELAVQVLEAQTKEKGMLGKIFGSREHAPTNANALAIVLLFVLLVIVLFAPLPSEVPKGGMISSIFSIITFALGLMFGRSAGGGEK